MDKLKLAQKLRKRNLTVSIAESCTGGLISKLLTDTSGSSKYFKLAVVAYSNQIKKNVLKIPSSILDAKGAVSKEVASLMAKNVRSIAKTDIGLGITGIAGPSGGSKLKPVGLVYICVCSKKRSLAKRSIFKGTRNQIRQKSASLALKLISQI